MIARGFKSVLWVATVGSAALGCYMVSLRVATERNELARVDRQIVAAKRDIRSLQTELGTRGRMTQLEQWNAEVLALAAPSSSQFLKDEFTLARLERQDPTVAERSAEIRLASADTSHLPARPSDTARPVAPPIVQAVAERPAAPPPLVHRASFATAEVSAAPKPAAVPAGPVKKAVPAPGPVKSDARPARPAGERMASIAAAVAGKEPATPRSIARPGARSPAKVEALRPAVAAGAKPVREAAAVARAPRIKGGGGN